MTKHQAITISDRGLDYQYSPAYLRAAEGRPKLQGMDAEHSNDEQQAADEQQSDADLSERLAEWVAERRADRLIELLKAKGWPVKRAGG